MKKLLSILSIFVLLLLTSCDLNLDFLSTSKHSHTYIQIYDNENHCEYCECGSKINIEAHDLTEWEVIIEASVSEEGLKQRKCKKCEYTELVYIDKLAHNHSFSTELEYDENYHFYKCECGEVSQKKLHNFTDWTIISDASLTENGLKIRECSICGYFQEEIIPKTSHQCDFSGDYKYNDLNHYKECSCGAKEYEEHDYTFQTSIIVENEIEYLKQTCKCGHYVKKELNSSLTSNYGYKNFKEMNEKYALFYADLYNELTNFLNSHTNVILDDGYYTIASINYSKYGLTSDEATAVWSIIQLDNPQFYFLSNIITYTNTYLNICINEDYIKYTTRLEIQNDIEQMVLECSKLINQNDNDVTKALKIHDFIIKRIDYAYESDGITPQDDSWAHSIVGVVQKKGGVCESYSKTYKYLCNIFEIESILVTGYSKNQNHAWNMIKIDDDWYHVDLTWNDQNVTIYNYFAVSEDIIKNDHAIKNSQDLNINYTYKIPETPSKSIELVTLYENDIEVGQFLSIDDAFNSMINEESKYKIKLHLYKYNENEKKLYIISNYTYSIYTAFPKVNSIEIYAIDSSYASHFNVITDLNLKASNTLLSEVTLVNINLNTKGYSFNISNYNLIFKGYSGGITGNYSKNSGEVIKNTTK